MYGIWAYFSIFSRVQAFLWNLDLYPDSHQDEKSDPDPHQIKNQNPDPHPDPHQGDKSNPGIRIRLCFIVMRIHNTGLALSNGSLSTSTVWYLLVSQYSVDENWSFNILFSGSCSHAFLFLPERPLSFWDSINLYDWPYIDFVISGPFSWFIYQLIIANTFPNYHDLLIATGSRRRASRFAWRGAGGEGPGPLPRQGPGPPAASLPGQAALCSPP